MHAAKLHSLTTSDGDSLIYYAAATGMYDVISALHDKGCNLNAENNKSMTSLYVACWNGQSRVIKALLSSGADINALALCSVSALHFAVASLNTIAVKFLISAGCEINVQSLSSLEEMTGIQQSYYNNFSNTALH